MTETHIKLAILKMIKKEFPDILTLKLSDKYYSGYPDLLLIINGMCCFIEIKTPIGKVSKIQEYTLQKIREAGGFAFVAHSVIEARNCVDTVLQIKYN
jgi:hypothetical protein